MRRILRNLSIALLCGALSVPAAFAEGRHNGATNGGRQGRQSAMSHGNASHNASRGQAVNPGHNNSSRPGVGNNGNHNGWTNGNHNNGNNSSRPAIGNNGNNHRPDNNGVKPGNNHNNWNNGNHNGNNSNRPGVGNNNNGNHNGNRPGLNDRPGVGNNGNHNGNRPGVGNNGNHNGWTNGNHNGNRPGVGNNHASVRPPYLAPPNRPYRPAFHRPHYRPTPPRGWRPAGHIPVIRGVIGLTFGTAIGLSLDYLYNSGFSVDGYTNDVVYLRNVNAMNYIWTDAALYYGSNGLDASTFYYSTPGYDLMRYNNVYNSLVTTYGMPVSVNNTVNTMTATWFGGNQGYVTLSFGPNTTNRGLRYLTTLTFGL